MNSLQLIQAACRKWLTVPDQSSMDVSATQDLLDGLNLVQGEVWRLLPVHYKRQPLSLEFYGPSSGSLNVVGYGSRAISGVVYPDIQDVLTFQGEPLYYEGEPLLFNGESVLENPRPYCTIIIDGDAQMNQFNGNSLVHPYLGNYSGPLNATIFHDTKLCPVMIERVISPMVDRISGDTYYSVLSHGFTMGQSRRRNYSLKRRLHAGFMRTVMELTPHHDRTVVLGCEALVAPVPLTLGSAQRAVDLPYDDETASLIVACAGANLRMHPKFNTERTARDTADSAGTAMRQLELLSPVFSNQFNSIGTPQGW